MDENIKASRKILLINPELQRKIMGLAALVPVIITVIHLIVQKILLQFTSETVTILLDNHRHRQEILLVIEQMGWALTICVLFISGICVLVTYSFGLKETHRIAGPITAAVNYLQKVKANTVSGPLRFREGDHFVELSDAINETLLHLGQKYSQDQKDDSKN